MTLNNSKTKTKTEFDPDTAFCLFRIPKQGARVIWEVTNTCNYGCRYCIFSSTSRQQKDELETDKILSTIDELKDAGFTHIKITGGEPFMRPDIMDILNYANMAGFRTDISTNASMITEDIGKELANLNLEMVHVSMDGHSQFLQEKVRGKRTYAPTMDGLKYLLDKDIYIRIGCVLYQDNQNNLKEMAEFCADLGCDEVIFSIMEPVGRMRNRPAFLCDRPVADMQVELNALKIEFKDHIKINYSFAEEIPKNKCGTCPGGERFLSIDHKGRISPCTWVTERKPEYCAEKTLHNYSLKEILRDTENTSFRNVVTEMSNAGLDKCPMQVVPDMQDIETIKDLFKNFSIDNAFSEISPIYHSATENITGYLEHLDVQGKSVLTIAGSGDQAINFAMMNAKNVTCFDINLLSKFMTNLKITMLKKLSFDNFKTFIFQGFDFELYKELRNNLPFSTRYFWDKAYSYNDNDGQKLCQSDLFKVIKGNATFNNPYLQSKGNYLKAQEKSPAKLNFIQSNITKLSNNIQPEFDIIHLSNISDYAHKIYDGDYLTQYRNDIIEPLYQKLKIGGTLVFGYVYDGLNLHGSDIRSDINKADIRQKIFAHRGYREIKIPSSIQTKNLEKDNHDIILIWEKKDD